MDALIPLLTDPKQMDFPMWLPVPPTYCAYNQDINLEANHSASDRPTSHIITTYLLESHQPNITMENSASYTHKKFAVSKRKRDVDHDKENLTQESEQPIFKRRQTQGFFRPWLDNEQNQQREKETSPMAKPTGPGSSVSQYRANMVRRSQTHRQRSPKEQMRRDRNTLACLLSRRAKQAQEEQVGQQYEQYRSHHAAMLEQQVRLSLYYRHILQQAVFQRAINPAPGHILPQQQQQFLQQMALSQQMLIFGGQHC
ncbi:protein Mabiki [Drosophila yakuba]|uniref:Protein Mabiki n=1 Tax=Drosophila yakuba TaxID=7245 RepID=B4P328_DROYA|nr:protein Mabiki [Drosophila yakuba]EDW88270.1 uncharacterized protein Dyak_GE18629 [Drosophila yakuba]